MLDLFKFTSIFITNLIILKLFFKKWREKKDFFILVYLFTNFTMDILNKIVDLPISFLMISIKV